MHNKHKLLELLARDFRDDLLARVSEANQSHSSYDELPLPRLIGQTIIDTSSLIIAMGDTILLTGVLAIEPSLRKDYEIPTNISRKK